MAAPHLVLLAAALKLRNAAPADRAPAPLGPVAHGQSLRRNAL